MALTEAEWRAEGCVERARAAVYDAMTGVRPDAVIAVWDSLDRVVAASPLVRATRCRVTARASGTGVQLNEADPEQLRRLFHALGIAPARADSLIDALLDWRDRDRVKRSSGAEQEWYAAHHRSGPRDSAFASVEELRLVRGFEHLGDTVMLFTTDAGRMPLSHVPLPVLASLPGMTPATLVHAAALRARGQRVPELAALGVNLPKEDYAQLMAHYEELSRRMVPEPEAWFLSAIVEAGEPPVHTTIRVRLARAGARVAIMGRQ